MVEIMGQRYPIKSALDFEYITHLAEYVDEKIQSATDHSTGGDTVRVTVLAALNIADEYFRARNRPTASGRLGLRLGGRHGQGADSDADQETELQRRTGEIEQMVDRALNQFD